MVEEEFKLKLQKDIRESNGLLKEGAFSECIWEYTAKTRLTAISGKYDKLISLFENAEFDEFYMHYVNVDISLGFYQGKIYLDGLEDELYFFIEYNNLKVVPPII